MKSKFFVMILLCVLISTSLLGCQTAPQKTNTETNGTTKEIDSTTDDQTADTATKATSSIEEDLTTKDCNCVTETQTEEPTTESDYCECTTTEEGTTSDTVTNDVMEAVKNAYAVYLKWHEDVEIDKEDIEIERYYSTYNDVAIVKFRIKDQTPEAISWSERFADITIDYQDERRMYAYQDGRIYTLMEAGEDKLLTYFDFLDISEAHLDLDTELLNTIKEAYTSSGIFQIDDVKISRYYGTYNGCFVAKFFVYGSGHYTAITGVNMGDIHLSFPNSNVAKAYYEGKFYSLSEAFEKGYLTREDALAISKIHYGMHPTKEQEVKIAFKDYLLKQNPSIEVDVEDIGIFRFYGSYGSFTVLMFEVDGMEYSSEPWTETVKGVEIKYKNGNRLYVLFEGEIYNLSEAYEEYILHLDSIANIARMQDRIYNFI